MKKNILFVQILICLAINLISGMSLVKTTARVGSYYSLLRLVAQKLAPAGYGVGVAACNLDKNVEGSGALFIALSHKLREIVGKSVFNDHLEMFAQQLEVCKQHMGADEWNKTVSELEDIETNIGCKGRFKAVKKWWKRLKGRTIGIEYGKEKNTIDFEDVLFPVAGAAFVGASYSLGNKLGAKKQKQEDEEKQKAYEKEREIKELHDTLKLLIAQQRLTPQPDHMVSGCVSIPQEKEALIPQIKEEL